MVKYIIGFKWRKKKTWGYMIPYERKERGNGGI